jgi:hypothetical protein
MQTSKNDPLVPVPLRIPKSVLAAWRTVAAEEKCTVSDVIRARLSEEAVKPLGVRPPRRRQPVFLGLVSGADPALLQALAKINGTLETVACNLPLRSSAESSMTVIDLLATLRSVEIHLESLVKSAHPLGWGN